MFLEFVNFERFKIVINEEVLLENINDVYIVDNFNEGILEFGDKIDFYIFFDFEIISDYNNICIIVLNFEIESKGIGLDCFIL